MKPMLITGVQIENFMRLRGCDLTFKGGALEIVAGRNKQGKTSLTRAIETCLAGKAAEPPDLLHGDASFASVTIYTDQDMVVERTWKLERNGTLKRTLKVIGAPGHSPGERVTKSAETLLQSLWAKCGAVDPAAFLDLGKTPAGRREQGAILRKVAKLDWDKLDRERDEVYAHRAEVNKVVSDLEGQLRALPPLEDAPADRRDVKALTEKLQRQLAHNRKETDLSAALKAAEQRKTALDACEAQLGVLAEARVTLTDARAPVAPLEQRVAELEQQLAEAKQQLSDAKHVAQQAVAAANDAHRVLLRCVGEAGLNQQLAWHEKQLKAALAPASEAAAQQLAATRDAIAAFVREDDTATLADISGAEAINCKVDGRASYLATKKKLEARRQEVARLKQRLKEIQAEKDEQLAEADLPDGLGFDENGITIHGRPIEVASHREQWEAALTVAFKQATHIGLVIMRDDRFDAEALAALRQRAEDRGVVVIIERVARTPEETCTIYVDDGTAEVVS